MPAASNGRKVVVAVAVIAVATAIFLFRRPAAEALLALGESVHALGVWGPVVVAGVLTLGIPLCLPSAPLLLASGVLFGPAGGFACAVVGVFLGGSLSFLLARRLLRSWVEKRLGSHTGFEVMNQALARDGLEVVALIRLSPAMPAWMVNYALGASRVSWRDYWLSTVAILPGIALYALAGAGLGDLAALENGSATPRGPVYYSLLGLGIAATLGASIVLGRRARRLLAAAEEDRG